MIRFRHQQHPIELEPKRIWSECARGETYRDTPGEQLRAIISSIEKGAPWRDVVATHYANTNPWLHAIVTSSQRDLFFRMHPPGKGSKILDIGSGWGQIALPLAQRSFVTALEPTPERLEFIYAVAQQEGIAKNMHFIESDFFSIEFESQFDLACCIGVLEWVPKFKKGDPREIQLDFLIRCRNLLAPGGRLVIGIENRLGLKYLLGANDDHIGAPNISVYDSELAQKKWLAQSGQALRSFTFTQPELANLIKTAGFKQSEFYSAFPDYKLAKVITPWGPQTDAVCANGAPNPEHDGTNGSQLPFPEELNSHYRSFSQLGITSAFAPSFFVIASN
jgi:2-polyprenyl-3-methyl-5-hydroxy-6-metoxy-1,4-benzoquinol methylase